MANKAYDEAAIQAIADAIRAKNGATDTYTVAQMATAIEGIETGGGDVTYATGTFTPTTNIALNSAYQIEHNLGYFPDVFLFWPVATSGNYRVMGIVARYHMFNESNESTSFGCYIAGYNTSNLYSGNIEAFQPTVNAVWIRSASAYNILGAGKIYKWLAIRGIE